jgi:hypothetical protein
VAGRYGDGPRPVPVTVSKGLYSMPTAAYPAFFKWPGGFVVGRCGDERPPVLVTILKRLFSMPKMAYARLFQAAAEAPLGPFEIWAHAQGLGRFHKWRVDCPGH